MKIVVTADLHLDNDHEIGGINPRTLLARRFEDYLRNIDLIFNYACQHADVLILAGDIYDSRVPSETIRQEFNKRLKDVIKKIPVIILVGNHDLYYKEGLAHTLGSLQVLELNNLHIIAQPSNVLIRECNFVCLPFISASKLKIQPNQVNQVWQKEFADCLKKSKSAQNIAIAHQTIVGGVGGDERVSLSKYDDHFVSLEGMDVSNLEIVFLGHLHRPQSHTYQDVKIVYPGSIENVDMGEATYDKRFLYYDTETKELDQVMLPSRKYYNVKLTYSDELSILEFIDKMSNLQDSVVKVTLTISEQDKKYFNRKKIEDYLSTKAWWSMGVFFDDKSNDKQDAKEARLSERMNMKEVMNIFFTDSNATHKQMLIELANKIIDEEESANG